MGLGGTDIPDPNCSNIDNGHQYSLSHEFILIKFADKLILVCVCVCVLVYVCVCVCACL